MQFENGVGSSAVVFAIGCSVSGLVVNSNKLSQVKLGFIHLKLLRFPLPKIKLYGYVCI